MALNSNTVALLAAEPKVLIDGWRLEQLAVEPEIVTPTGICIDENGHLFVIECNTHFPPADYSRSPVDRIYMYEGSSAFGDRSRHVFREAGEATMNIASLGDGWLAIATRSHIVRVRDTDGDNVADEEQVLLTLATEAEYPHNGLGGLCLGGDGWLYVGLGENFGAEFELKAADGSTQVGSGEGGNVFRIRPDGSSLNRIATGFWNPFGLCFDSSQRLWAVGNDPDSMPPCRLLHVVPGGDYGFEFRFGRAGTNPLQAWDGELPGTLPMTAGTGEAPCAVIEFGGNLWVTSWGDNRIERYSLSQHGASWKANVEIVVQGDANFRPVGMAAAKDGSIYFTDWVDRSYPVHGKGRIWRLVPTNQNLAKGTVPQRSELEEMTRRLSSSSQDVLTTERLRALDHEDVFVRTSAVAGLVASGQLQEFTDEMADTPGQELGLILAYRWLEMISPDAVDSSRRRDIIKKSMSSSSSPVVLAAIRWATEKGCVELLPAIESVLENYPEPTPELFSATIAAIAFLQDKPESGDRDDAMESMLAEMAFDSRRSPRLRSLALRYLPVSINLVSNEQLLSVVRSSTDRMLGLEVVRMLSGREDDGARQSLAEIAGDESIDVQTRADALAALSRNAAAHAKLINRLSLPRENPILRSEARRISVNRAKPMIDAQPAPDELDKWSKLIGEGGDIDAGRRVFVRTTCQQCHAHSGRGARTGPDLTSLAGKMDRQRVLESILLPSKEIGPMYVAYRVLTVDGKLLVGLKLDGSGAGETMRFQAADGSQFTVATADIEAIDPAPLSIMPQGLQNNLTVEELRDLVAFLSASLR